jgi:DNA-binding transcriptional LysR family regulator
MLDLEFLEPERLRAFVAVAETNSFTRAAERLYLTQPTVSTQVRRLEEAIGRPLFERQSQSVHLTKDGEAMLGYARELLEVIRRARLQFAEPPLEGSMKFGLVDDLNATVLPEILGRLRRQYSRFELIIGTGTSANLFSLLNTGSLDLILTKRIAGSTQGEFLCRQKLVWVGQPGVLEQENGVVPLVVFPPKTVPREIILGSLRKGGRRWSIRFESASIAGQRAAVLAGLGVAAFGVGMIPPDMNLLPPLTLPPLSDAEFVLEQNPDSKDPVVAAFATILRNVVPIIIERLMEEQAGMMS